MTVHKARSRRYLKLRLRRLKREAIILAIFFLIYLVSKLVANVVIFHPVQALANTDKDVEVVVQQVPVIHVKEVDRRFDSEKQQILAYMVEKFGDRAPDAISLVNLCENHSFDPQRVSPLNIQDSGRRSYDIGVMQINADEHDTAEIEKLKDYKYNIDRGYAKYKAAGNKFTAWTCAHVVGEKNYLGK